MLTLSRGGQTIWMSDVDAAKIGVADNDWIEATNRNGIVVVLGIRRVDRYDQPLRPVVPPRPLELANRFVDHASLRQDIRSKRRRQAMPMNHGQDVHASLVRPP